jgi:ATP-binding cassette subfamily F protein uup
LVLATLEQNLPGNLSGSVKSHLSAALCELDLEHGWQEAERIERVLGDLGLDPGASVENLSAGAQRRVALARALVLEPDLLILDEPTNHLDIEAVLQLEEHLLRRQGALVFVTHDRVFLRRLATRILDLDRGRLASYSLGWSAYLERREAELLAEENQNAQFDKHLASEEAWLRRGVKARRTRNQGRVRALKAMRIDRAARRDVVARTKAEVNQAGRSGRLVLRAKDISVSYGDLKVLDGVTLDVQRGDRIGIVGPNGAGKSTLLSVLLGELEPDAGTVATGTGVRVGRFDQLHSTLDENKTVQENVADHADTITVAGHSRHILGYLSDFLFSPEVARGPITALSGGERNRLQLARLLARPCNLLVLDEPTNDLDVETLELLEELLVEFDGTLLVVSHDREFLDRVVTSTLVFEGDGCCREYVGGYSDWRRTLREESEAVAPRAVPKAKRVRNERAGPRRRTFKEKHELAGLPERIEELETSRAEIEQAMTAPEFYRREGTEIAADTAVFEALGDDLEEAYRRWEELEELAE